jgi:hypothetical protein
LTTLRKLWGRRFHAGVRRDDDARDGRYGGFEPLQDLVEGLVSLALEGPAEELHRKTAASVT